MLLYPQLPHHVAAYLTETLRRLDVAGLAKRAIPAHPDAVFTATGGARVGEEKLSELRDVLVRIATTNGYPEWPSEDQRLTFDRVGAVALHSRMHISPAEAAKRGVWEHMACVVAPDLVRWRFPGEGSASSPDRFLAGRRNTFSRLWWRAHLLRDESRNDNPYALLGLLGEDEVVQIMERPNLAGFRRLTAQVAAGFLSAMGCQKVVTRRVLIREVQKHLLRLSSIVMFDALRDDQLQAIVQEMLNRVGASAAGTEHE